MSYFDEVRLIVVLVLIFNDIYTLDAHRADIKNGKDKKQGFSVEVELM